jgi:hypothetical protein
MYRDVDGPKPLRAASAFFTSLPRETVFSETLIQQGEPSSNRADAKICCIAYHAPIGMVGNTTHRAAVWDRYASSLRYKGLARS